MKPSSEKITPKYDPCRKFCKGDKVQVIRRDGRIGSTSILVGASATVEEQEDNDNFVILRNPSPKGQPFICIHSLFLKLLAPVEELEPYSVVQPENYKCVRIMEGKRIHSSIPFDEDECVCRTLEQAKAAAEAECARLNAEYRKEQA